MIRKAALTVRLPGASTTPATSTSAWSQTGAVKKHRNAAINETKAGGASDAGFGFVDGRVPMLLHRAGLGPRAGAGGRRGAGARQANRERGLAYHGAWNEPWFCALSSCAEPGALGQSRHRAQTAGDDPRYVVARRPRSDRHRRHDRAALGAEDCGPRHLPGSGTLVSRALRQGERPAMAFGHGHGVYSAGRSALGLALPDGVGTVAALERRARSPAQEADGLGAPGNPSDQALAAEAPSHRGRRLELRCARSDRGDPTACLPC